MNVLNGSCCLSRYCRKTLWHTSCCRDKPTASAVIEGEKLRLFSSKKVAAGVFQSNWCKGLFLLSLWPTHQNQVRQSHGNRLHRDIEFPNFDPYRKNQYIDVRKTTWGSGDEKPGYTYIVSYFGIIAGTYGLKTELVHFISYMGAAADVLAMASIEVDISKIAEGACVSYKWRGKPLFIKHRTQADIDLEAKTPMSELRDPQTPEARTVKPEWLVVIGICTHLGCVPIPNSGDWAGGFYCPCHGSHYDNVGRTRKGPAPTNLEVPPYKFVSDSVVLVG